MKPLNQADRLWRAIQQTRRPFTVGEISTQAGLTYRLGFTYLRLWEKHGAVKEVRYVDRTPHRGRKVTLAFQRLKDLPARPAVWNASQQI